MVAMTVLLCTARLSQFEHAAWKLSAQVLVDQIHKREHTVRTLDTALVLLIIVPLHPSKWYCASRLETRCTTDNDLLKIVFQ